MQTSEINCGKCNKFIPVRIRIIKCDTCEHFFHVKCCDVNHRTYNSVKQSNNDWHCERCTSNVSNTDELSISMFHTKNTKAQEEICFILSSKEAEKVLSYPSEQATDPGASTLSTCATHTPTPSLPTTQTQVTSSPHIHQSPLHRSVHDHLTTTITTT